MGSVSSKSSPWATQVMTNKMNPMKRKRLKRRIIFSFPKIKESSNSYKRLRLELKSSIPIH
jgi:hypothetical protein